MRKAHRPLFIAQLNHALRVHRAGGLPWDLFERRIRTPRAARWPLPLLPVVDAGRALAASLDQPGQERERVVYVHVPFCRSLCSFCGYCREIPTAPDMVRAYTAAVRQQLAAFASRPWSQSKPFSAIHFGGGTPTLLPSDALAALIRDVEAALPLARDVEITVESTISDLEDADLLGLVAAGMNRLALGVQTFDSDRRRALGRRSPREAVLAGIAAAKAAGIPNLCIDLMVGLPGQTAGSWNTDLETAGTCGATGASVYPLVPFPSSQLGRQLATERRDAFPDLATEYEFFMVADNAMLRLPGWSRFSPVQYGHASAGTAKYITACGRGADILALGAGAAGSLHRLTYLNTPNIEEYARAWNENGHWPVTAAQSTGAHEVAKRCYALGETTRLERPLMSEEPAFTGEILASLVELGLAKAEKQTVSLTSAGCFWAGNISEIFAIALRDRLG